VWRLPRVYDLLLVSPYRPSYYVYSGSSSSGGLTIHNRMFEQLVFLTPLTIHDTNIHDLNPWSSSDNSHPSVLTNEMMEIEHGEKPCRILTWKPTGFLPNLVGHPQRCSFRHFQFDPYGDHLQTCLIQSGAHPTHDWVVHRLSSILSTVRHRVKTHKIITVVDNELGDIEIKDYVVLPRGQDSFLPPHPLILDFTMTHDLYGTSQVHTTDKFTYTRSSDGSPNPDVVLKNTGPSFSPLSSFVLVPLPPFVPLP
jgi:hypothetical protein